MSDPKIADDSRRVAPKDVFQRSNMPSRWERITGVAPKTATDRKYLAYAAARYAGEKRLPHPDALAIPDEFDRRQRTRLVCLWAAAAAIAVMIIGFAAQLVVAATIGIAILVCALVGIIVVTRNTAPAIREFYALRSRCERAELRLHADPLDPQDSSTINTMINCDEGTLTYCAAKIASEIEHDPAWESSHLAFVQIDLWDELEGIGQSARQIAEDRKATEKLERGRLRNDPEVRAMIKTDKQRRDEALALLTSRVHAFADYRDRVQRDGTAARREHNELSRTMRLVADEQAIDRLR